MPASDILRWGALSVAIALLGGCLERGIEGQLHLSGTVAGDTTLEPDRCESVRHADWAGGGVSLHASQLHWEIILFRNELKRADDVQLVAFGRFLALGACDERSVSFSVDDDGDINGHLRLSCELVAGGRVEGWIEMRHC
jgi:hypothetical protein